MRRWRGLRNLSRIGQKHLMTTSLAEREGVGKDMYGTGYDSSTYTDSQNTYEKLIPSRR
ncbi:MAG: hypothetical protein M1503_10040 [Thaumarchaeota archaeon]|nr:hypothetical protein [Nitrososphaerota archaeon]MCL5318581.1 hypothetical protein [Nitrososphaerota archaeon]